jgi:hypothetical protein
VTRAAYACLGIGLYTVGLLGCGAGNKAPRAIVNGAVNLAGVPVEDGQIRFIPIEGTDGPITITAIRGGKYLADDKGGVPVGKHRVEVLAWDPDAPPGGRGEPPRPQWAPDKFNTNSELTASVEDAGDPVVIDFDL